MKTRYFNLDLLRCICAFAIIIIHVTSAALTYSTTASKSVTVAMHLSTILMAWAVPCFFMITGFLWLGDDKECSYATIWKHILKFVAVLFTIGFFYALLEIVFTTNTVSFTLIFDAFVNVLKGKLWDHMWYVYAVIGVYLILPLIKPFFIHSKFKDYAILLLISFLYTIVLPYINDLFDYSMPIKFAASGWIFYVMFGGFVGKYKQFFIERKRFVSIVNIIVFLVSVVGIVIKYIINPSFQVVSYTSISVAMLAMVALVFTITQNDIRFKNEKLILNLSACCWGIYLIHPFFINFIIKLIKINPIDYVWWLSIPLTCVILFIVCGIIIWILRKISFIKKYLF